MKKFLKRFKGFTLIELLAVIVILAIIAIIAIPIVMNIINESRKNAAVASADGYIRAVNYKIAQEGIAGNIVPLGEYIIGENELDVDAKNKDRITGAYEIGETGVLTAGLCIDKYSIEYSSGKAYYKKEANYCGGEYVFEEPNGTLLSSICEGTSGDTIYQNNTEFKIKTVEDLVCFSQLTNSGKNFSGKKVYLLSNLDINNPGSYKNSNTTKYADANGNGNTEGLLTELTTGAGFKQIGTQSTPFSGTFDGYAFTISNLMINKPTENNIGLFGYNTGIVRGLSVKNANVTGYQNVGGVVGYSTGTVKNIYFSGDVSGNAEVGGICGYSTNSSTLKDVVVSANISGSNIIGGVCGRAYSTTGSNGAIIGGSVTAPSNGYSGTVFGQAYGSYYGGALRSINRTGKAIYAGSGVEDGEKFDGVSLEVLDNYIDTYIGGDNDSDKYYFDYDSNGDITLFSTERTPIQNKLRGEGTSEKPYIIKNDKDWKMASATISESGKYYSVINDIDFSGKKFYVFGTNANKFTGNLNGDMHTISNINLYGTVYAGIIGYNNGGTIEGFNFNNVSINGSGNYLGIVGYSTGIVKGINGTNINVIGASSASNVGGLVGYSTGLIQDITMQSTVTGANDIGGVIGYSTNVSKYILANSTVSGNDEIGGVAGRIYGTNSHLTNVVLTGGNITAASRLGRVAFYADDKTKHYALSTISVTTSSYGSHGTNIDSSLINDLDAIRERINIETDTTGDVDNSGYVFGYNSDNSKIIVLKYSE